MIRKSEFELAQRMRPDLVDPRLSSEGYDNWADTIHSLAEALTEALNIQPNHQDQDKFKTLREKGWL